MTNNIKKKRKVDRELLDCYQNRPCLICEKTETTVAHHIISKGSGGDDDFYNLIPLCWNHHDEIHRTSLKLFCKKYSKATAWLEYWGWEFFQDKWYSPKK